MGDLRTLGQTVDQMDLPFGYTLTVWSSEAVAIDRFGFLSLVGALLFVVGAIGADLVCAVLSCHELGAPITLQIQSVAAINVFAVIAAVAVSVVAHLLSNPPIGYLLAGFVGTLTYILCVSALTYWADLLNRQRR